jgi:hypothetical protein
MIKARRFGFLQKLKRLLIKITDQGRKNFSCSDLNDNFVSQTKPNSE